jgi:hypothetical protein
LTGERLEAEFLALLRRLRPNGDDFANVPEMPAKVWAAAQGDAEKETRRLKGRLDEQKMDVAETWQIAKPEQRHGVQNLLFEDGLSYSEKTGILNRSKTSLFGTLELIRNSKVSLAPRRDLNPCYRGERRSGWHLKSLQHADA